MTPARSDLSWWEWLLTGALVGDVFANWRRDRRERRYARRKIAEQHYYTTALGRAAAAAGGALDKAVDGFNDAAVSAIGRRW